MTVIPKPSVVISSLYKTGGILHSVGNLHEGFHNSTTFLGNKVSSDK